MKKTKCKYMHTINGKPAMFDGDMVCFISYIKPEYLRESLRQIRRDQDRSNEYRSASLFVSMAMDYGYMRVYV